MAYDALTRIYLYSGFGFVSFVHKDDSDRACAEMNGAEVDGRTIRVEKARRGSAYEKTPGRCTYILRLKTKQNKK
jgi:RNA recognition motif-containing protein